MDDKDLRLLIDLHREVVQDLHEEAQRILSRLTKRLDRNHARIEESFDTLLSREKLGEKERAVLKTLRSRLEKLSDSGGGRSTSRLKAIVEYFSDLRRFLAKAGK